MITGDFVFVGDVGRPDLLDEAAGGIDTRFEGAKQMFASLRDQFLTLPDYVQVHPGHGADSACGKALGAIASSTVGYERRFAWWSKHLQENDLEAFTAPLLEGQPNAPAYFGRMKHQNKTGPELLGDRGEFVALEANTLQTGTLLPQANAVMHSLNRAAESVLELRGRATRDVTAHLGFFRPRLCRTSSSAWPTRPACV